MIRKQALVLVAATLAAIAVAAAAALGAASDPKQMAIAVADLGRGAVVDAQGATTSGPIPARRGYQRSFTGVTLGKANLFTLQDTVLVGKTSAAAAKLVSAILLATSSKSGRNALYLEAQESFSESAGLTVQSGAVTRAGALEAGDGAVEVVFRFDTARGSFQVGEVFVRVGGNLSAIYYGAGTPGLTQAGARRLALAAAKHMHAAGATG